MYRIDAWVSLLGALLLTDTVNGPVIDRDGDGSPRWVDCNDRESAIYPGALDVCDDLDNDCDGLVDNRPAYLDHDGDGWGSGDTVGDRDLCGDVDAEGQVYLSGDCDDSNAQVYPGKGCP